MRRFLISLTLLALTSLASSVIYAQNTESQENNTELTERELFHRQRKQYYYRSFRQGWNFKISMSKPSELTTRDFVKYISNSYKLHQLSDYHNLYEYYHPYGPTYTSGTFMTSAEYDWLHWLSIGADLGLGFHWNQKLKSPSVPATTTEVGSDLILVPYFKIVYVNRPVFRFYSAFGCGLGVVMGQTNLNNRLHFAPQFTPLGIELGKKHFGFTELGYGYLFTGFRFGFGYKF